VSLDLADLLLILTPGLPTAVAVLWPVVRLRPLLERVAPWAALPALTLALLPGVEGASWATFGIMTGLRLEVDGVGRAFLLVTALLWLVVGAFAARYHRDDPRKGRFLGFFVATMAGNLGLVVAADGLSFYLFFALMTFAAYGLIVHRADEEAFRAGRVYIVLAVLGEIAVLAAIFMLGAAADGAPGFGSDMARTWGILAEAGHTESVAVLVVVGFGIKAGLVPLHLWLPLAHPVAPTAASALLSGAMIKGGLLAWIRYLPAEAALPTVSVALIVVGALATLYGVAVGLAQDDPKTVLAYSSVSQMGFMALGMGLVTRGGAGGAAAILAVVVYALHHAVAKGALFLSVGVADRVPLSVAGSAAAGTTGARRVGWKAAVLAGAALPALALSGAPGSTGAMSKATLKDAVYELAPGLNDSLGVVLTVAGVGTTLLLVRFLVLLMRRMERREARSVRDPGAPERAPSPRATVALVSPWAVLLLAGVAGPWWLPHVVPEVGGAGPAGAFASWGTAGGAVLAGIVLAVLVGRRPTVLLGLQKVRVPAGDLLVPVEGLIHALGRARNGAWHERADLRTRALEWGWRLARTGASRLADRDLLLAGGRIVGCVVLVLVVGLAVLLS
jgi:formate hydrogenlyase subunit 3/multisubunit Na+/H+ antiporter MnhD subunit